MIPPSALPVDARDTNALLAEFQNRRRGYLPRWNPPAQSSGAAMGPIFARLIYAILGRLNQAPAKDKLAFLDLLGIRLISAQPARAPIVFSLTSGAADCSAPEGTQVAAPPSPGSSNQIVFSTEQDAAVAAANLTEIVSLWPGRDQYINHSAARAAEQPFTLFQNLQLTQTDHILYLAHSKILAFAGNATLRVSFDLSQDSTSALEIAWEYWDGQVWRGFIFNSQSCLGAGQTGYDGTNGFSTTGSVRLSTQGSPASQGTVNGVTSYWIRGRLTQPLLPVQSKLLPEVDTIRLTTQIDQHLELKVTATFASAPTSASATTFLVFDECGQAITSATITITPPNSSPTIIQAATDGSYTLPSGITLNSGDSCRFAVLFKGISGTTFAVCNVSSGFAVIAMIVKIEGLLPDKAFCDGKTLDTTKAFYPLGQAPAPGSTFYFKQTEAFSKPGAVVSVYLAPAVPPTAPPASGSGSGGSSGSTANLVAHTINWEYWNGYEWSLLAQSANSTVPASASGDFTVNEVVPLTIPADMAPTTVNNDMGLYIRARLVAGGYGIAQTISIPSAVPPVTIGYIQPQPPIVGVFRFGYTWTQGPYALESVFTYNDFQFEDRTSDALYPGSPFAPFQPVSDVTPTVYLGFDKLLPVNNYGVYLDIVEQVGLGSGPAMVWEYWNGGWESVSAEDETQALALPGVITFLPAADAQPLARFDNPLYWLRGRLKEDQPPNEITINDVLTNAVWASQWQTFQNSPLGLSAAAPSQIFPFNQVPVLPGQEIEVQELNGPRANTEWRIIALQVEPDDPDIVTELEALLAAEGPQTDIIMGNVHLVRDKTKSVTSVWVQWQEVQNFFESGPNDRVYVLDHAMGRLFFGDGRSGMIPPSGATIQATSFRSGGGLAGNVAASTITQLLGSLSGISGVTNPRAAEGGADGETLEKYQARAPLSVRNRGRAMVEQDYETMAHEASAGVAVARAIGPLDPSGRPVPGWVTLVIIPQSNDPRPTPSAGLRQDVLNYLLSRVPADVAAAQRINVIGPTYLPVDVAATLAPSDPAQAGTVEQDAIEALETFLNPLTGGPEGLGWDVGRGLYASDLAATLGEVDGVDYVESLSLYVNGVLQGEQVQVPAGQIVVAGELQLSLVLPATQ